MISFPLQKWRLDPFLRVIWALILTIAAALQAHAQETSARPTLRIPPKVSISERIITIGNIAQITDRKGEHVALVAALKAVSLGESPPPMMRTSIAGQKILSTIESAGIALDSFGYSIPQLVIIEHKGRLITREEILPKVSETLAKDTALDLQVREVNWYNPQVIPDGPANYTIERLGMPESGKVPLRITALVNSQPVARFLATATVDDWRDVPVLNKSLERGMLISPEDIQMVRMNLFKQPPSIAESTSQVIGRRAKQRISAGETIKKNFIDIPPVIASGRSLTILYRSGGLTATASGIALEDGFDDSTIKVKNMSSHRTVRARVVNSEQVEVIP